MRFLLSNKKDMGLNPASVNLDTGVVTINSDIWRKLSPVQKKLILLHEKAHFVLQALDDELACDRWAIEKYAGTEKKSLRKALEAYYILLNKDYIPEDRKRQILITCLTIDYEKFGNDRAKLLLDKIESGKENEKNYVDIIAAVVAIAGTLISLGSAYLWGKKNYWAREKGVKKTAIRESIAKNFAKKIIGTQMQSLVNLGYDGSNLLEKIKKYTDDYNTVARDIFSQMVLDGFFIDNNVGTFNWGSGKHTYEKFTSEKYYSWFPSEVKKYANDIYLEIEAAINEQGTVGKIFGNIPTWIFYAIGGVVLLIVLKKIRK